MAILEHKFDQYPYLNILEVGISNGFQKIFTSFIRSDLILYYFLIKVNVNYKK